MTATKQRSVNTTSSTNKFPPVNAHRKTPEADHSGAPALSKHVASFDTVRDGFHSTGFGF